MNKKRFKHIWTPPKGAAAYFSRAADVEFKQAHPIGYIFLELLGIVALVLPMGLYITFMPPVQNDLWVLLGCIGSIIIGIGFFNFVAIIIDQYLGHLVSILSFVVGGLFVWISLVQTGIV